MATDTRVYMMHAGWDDGDPWYVIAEMANIESDVEDFASSRPSVLVCTREQAMNNPRQKRAIFAWEAGDDSAARLAEDKLMAWGKAQDAELEKEIRTRGPDLRAVE